MSNQPLQDVLVWRPVVDMESGSESYGTFYKYHRIASKSVNTLIKVYKVEGRSLKMHMPAEDMKDQKEWGGSKSKPVLFLMVSPNGLPLVIPSDRSLKMFRNLPDFVAPVFTSKSRIENFIDRLIARKCKIPEHEIKTSLYTPEIKQDIQANRVVVNPIPEFVLSTFMVIAINPDGEKGLAIWEFKEEDLHEGDAFEKFFHERQ